MLPLRYVRSGRESFTAVEGGFSGAVRFPLEQKGERNITKKRASIWEGLLTMAHDFWGWGGQEEQATGSEEQMCIALWGEPSGCLGLPMMIEVNKGMS